MKRKYTSLLLACLMLSAQVWAELTTTTIGDKTYYQIGTGADLLEFAALVNDGEYDANAVLTANIDMSGKTMTPIGINESGKRYNGTFDGQGHHISNLKMDNSTAEPYGLFLSLWNGTLKNFYLDATCSITGLANVGLVGRIHGATEGGSDTKLENVGNAGNITSIKISGDDGGNAGGLVGGVYGNTTFNNCWTSGTVTAPNTKNRNAGAFCGWVKMYCATEKATFNDCWSSATLPRYTSGTYLSRRADTDFVVFNNCYAKNGTQPGSTAITTMDETNGRLCYLLNGSSSESPAWFQTIDTDGYPVPDSSHGTVHKATSATTDYYYNDAVSSMTLTDAADYVADADFTATSLTYNRTLAAGGYHSLCLPFAVTTTMLGEGSKLFTLTEVGTDAVTLTETSSVAAGVPCFASVTSDFNFNTLTLESVPMVASVNNSGTIKGTFTEITGDGAVGVYKLDSNGEYFAKTVAVEGEITDAPVIKPFRSYIAGGASGVKTLNILLSDGTSLTPTLSEEKEAVIYDLAGRRVTKATKGIYIVNGKKVMK